MISTASTTAKASSAFAVGYEQQIIFSGSNGELKLQTPDHQTSTVSLPHKTKAVLFDLDDTLFDRAKVFHTWATSFVQTHLVSNDGTSEEEIINFIIIFDARGYTSRNKLFSQIREMFPSLQEATGVLIERYYQHQIARLELTEGANTLLQALQSARIPIGIVMHTVWLKRTQEWPETLSSSIADLTIASLAELHTLFSAPA